MFHRVFAHADGRVFKSHMVNFDVDSCPMQTRMLMKEVFA